MKNLKLVFLLSSVIILAMIGCKKGDAGPAGPKGPAGPDSVIYSAWITLSTALTVGSANDTSYQQKITAPSITQSIIDKGVIVSYIDIPDNTGDHIFPTASIGSFFAETFSVGSIDIFSLLNLTGDKYRYVIVAGTIQSNRIISGPAAGLTLQQLQTMSYADIQKLVGTPASSSSN